ncbi:MAG: hypothetical protein II596_02485 [Thermoguttaceae bacterium]|nr:hypothetical protein [Thermoguttaceae bacterium]
MRNEQGVIVSLIVFIVLTLAFGVATYFGAKGFQEQKAALATARSELQSAIAENDTLRADLTNFKTRLGYGFGSADEIINGKDGSEKRVDKNGEEAAVHYAGMTDDVQKALGSDTNFKDAFGKLTAQLAAVNKQIADAVAERDGNIKEAQKQIASAANQKETFDAGVAKLSADHQQNLETARAEYDDLTKQFNEQTKEFDVQKRNARDAIAEAKTETEKDRSAADNFAEINLDLSRRIDLLTNNDFDTADAVVVSTDQVGKSVRLSVGTKDGVRPLTQFNVFPTEALEKGGVKAKAKVQVTRTLEEHVCEAKILEDDQNNPIQPGDLVFTPLWRPGEVYKYALDYRLDINGDGVSDLGEIYNMIQITGGEVSAYIDDAGKVHGKITPDVFRLVVCDASIADRANMDGGLSEEQREKIIADETAFVASAGENGVRTMRLPDLLAQIGYKKTDQLARYRDEQRVGERQAGESSVAVGNSSVVPVFRSEDGEVKPGSILPVFPEGAEEQVKEGNVTFRKRTPRN